MPGLPGTGLGGLFYALLILWVGVVEGWRTVNGRGSPLRWRRFAGLASLLAAMVAALWLWGLLLAQLIELLTGAGVGAGTDARRGIDSAVPVLTLAPFAVLAALLAAMHATRLILGLRRSERTGGLGPQRAD